MQEEMRSLRDVRRARGRTQEDLAALSGVTVSTISQLENPKVHRVPRMDVVRQLSLALDVNPFLVRELNDAILQRGRTPEKWKRPSREQRAAEKDGSC